MSYFWNMNCKVKKQTLEYISCIKQTLSYNEQQTLCTTSKRNVFTDGNAKYRIMAVSQE